MTQKLTEIILDGVSGETATREKAVSPIQTKRDRLAHVWKANAKKAWRTRKRMAAARAQELTIKPNEINAIARFSPSKEITPEEAVERERDAA